VEPASDEDADVEDDAVPDDEDCKEAEQKELVWAPCIFEQEAGDMRRWRPPKVPGARSKAAARGFGTKQEINTPGSIFKQLWPDSLLNVIAAASTAYAATRYTRMTPEKLAAARPKKPPTYTCKDISDWFMAMMTMGIVKLPNLKMYWSKEWGVPNVQAFVSSHAKFARTALDIHMLNTLEFSPVEQVNIQCLLSIFNFFINTKQPNIFY